MKAIMTMALLVLMFSGCSEKLMLAKPPCIHMSEIVQPEVQEIRVENNDIDLYIAYINEFRGKIDYQNELIREMNTNCTSWTVMDEEIEQ